ncbi:MAG: hypothetical protein ACOCWA_08685 [Bacteroidota bacterium]
MSGQNESNLDPALYNGSIYNYGSANILGHPFLHSRDFSRGSVIIDGIHYKNLLLNYDIFNQKIVFQFEDDKSTGFISIPKEVISSFMIDNRNFTILHKSNWDHTIYEKIDSKDLSLLIKWIKRVKVSVKDEIHDFEYTPANRTMYLLDSGKMKKLRRKKDFIKSFDENKKSDIKKFMRKNRIRFRSANSEELTRLLKYSNAL